MFKATFVNCNKMTKREENNYVNLCEQNLKQNTLEYFCHSKEKIRNDNQLNVIIIYDAKGHRARMED